MTRDEALAYWFRADTHTYVAESDWRVVGTYILKPNQPALGSHIANAAFMVGPTERGLGVGRKMGEHCLNEARRLGFRAMQFNFVVSANTSAIHLWEQLGFKIVGTLPGAFRHPEKGYSMFMSCFARWLTQPLRSRSVTELCLKQELQRN
jgi:GNAT superfamily N-acetyltransferase